MKSLLQSLQPIAFDRYDQPVYVGDTVAQQGAMYTILYVTEHKLVVSEKGNMWLHPDQIKRFYDKVSSE